MRKSVKKTHSASKKKLFSAPVRHLKKTVRKKSRNPKLRKHLSKPPVFRTLPPATPETPPPFHFQANPHVPSDSRLPTHYGEDKLMLLVRDPWWIYAYWEVTPDRNGEVVRRLRQSGHRDWKTVLRVYDVTGAGPGKSRSFFDIELNFFADNWYIDVGLPDREWLAELGLRTASGKFFMLVRSNVVRTPSFGISDVVDEEWMLPEDIYYRLIGLGMPGAVSGSMDIRKLLEKYLKRVVSSETLPKASLLK